MDTCTRKNRFVTAAVLAAVLTQASGCGTIIYPERRGQTSGQIDPAVAILDGVGVIIFIIPGLIAFAIDFATGAIYLPAKKGDKVSSLDSDMRLVKVDAGTLNWETINDIIHRETGIDDITGRTDLQAQRLADLSAAAPLMLSRVTD